MTTFASARAELVAALATVGNGATSEPGGIAPPYVFVASEGADVTHVTRGAVESSWRMVLVAGGWADKASADALDVMKQAALPILRALDGWQVQALGRDGMRTFGASDYLTAELRGVRMVDL